MIKLIALDLDGTTLTDEHKITQATHNAIKTAQEKGIKVMIATGRNIATSRYLIQELGLTEYLLTGNGANLSKDGEIIFDKCYPHELSVKIIEILRQSKLKFIAYYKEGAIADELGEWEIHYQNERQIEFKILSKINLQDYAITKFLVTGNQADLDILSAKLAQLSEVNVTSSNTNNIEILLAGVNKKTGLDHVVQMMGITWDNVMTCGDNYNDLEMILAAKIGVAMGNGHDSVKAQADFVTKTNNENGVAFAIEKYINQVSFA